MTQEETKEAIRVMQGYVNGKKIESKWSNDCDWVICNKPDWDWYDFDYRIAPDQEEPKDKHYRPYTMEEFVQDMHKHDGFVKERRIDLYGLAICRITKTEVQISDLWSIDYASLSNHYVWSDDGTPCGKEVAE